MVVSALAIAGLLCGAPQSTDVPTAAPQPRARRRLGLSYSLSGGPGFTYFDGAGISASVDGFIGLGIWEEVSLGISSQATFMHIPYGPYDYLAHRTSLFAQGRGGQRDRLYWGVGMGLGAVHALRGGWDIPGGLTTYALFDHAPVVLRMGWWHNRRPGRAQLFVALQGTLDLYWAEFPYTAFGLAVHVGIGRV